MIPIYPATPKTTLFAEGIIRKYKQGILSCRYSWHPASDLADSTACFRANSTEQLMFSGGSPHAVSFHIWLIML